MTFSKKCTSSAEKYDLWFAVEDHIVVASMCNPALLLCVYLNSVMCMNLGHLHTGLQ